SFLRRWNVTHRAGASAKEPEILTQGTSQKWTGTGNQLTGVVPVRNECNAGVSLLPSGLHDRQLGCGKRCAPDGIRGTAEEDRWNADELVVSIDAEPAGANFQHDLRLVAIVHQPHAVEQEL